MTASDTLRRIAKVVVQTTMWDQGPDGTGGRLGYSQDATIAWMRERVRLPTVYLLLADALDELAKHSSQNEHDYANHAKADALLDRAEEITKNQQKETE